MKNRKTIASRAAAMLAGTILTLILMAGSAAAADLDLSTMEPYQQTFSLNMLAGYSGVNGYILVPQGKMLVIEQISVSGRAPSDQRIDMMLQTQILPDQTRRSHFFSSIRQTLDGVTYHKLSQSVKIYCDYPSMAIRITRNTTLSAAYFDATVSGYFIDR